jgi:hypothetical protein
MKADTENKNVEMLPSESCVEPLSKHTLDTFTENIMLGVYSHNEHILCV